MATSPPAPPSPTSSNESIWDKQPTLEQLVEHFLASKKSLSAIKHVSRAREIVDAGRQALEENAALSAKNTFVRHTIDKQIEGLEAIRHGSSVVDTECHSDFQTIVKSLDEADARLNNALDALRQTIVEPSFRPPDEDPKSLFDFVDESGIDNLYDSIRQSMDRYKSVREHYQDICDTFDRDLAAVHQSVIAPPDEEEAEKRMVSYGSSPIPVLHLSLETHATETAKGLEGLVKHYDLCVTALKHTEGGGEAITRAESSDQEEQLVGMGLDLATIENQASPQEISDAEKAEMLAVLQKDAAEVDDVVNEIKDRLAEMEEQLTQVAAYIQILRNTAERLRHALKRLKEVASKVPGYINDSAEFQGAWTDEKALLMVKMEEVEALANFNSGFADAYDGLIVEAQRRKHVRNRMEKIMKEAMSHIEQLYQDDTEQREAFWLEQGAFLPKDLWAGFENSPPRYVFVSEDENAAALPDISKEVYQRALQRVKARRKPSIRSEA